MIVLGIILLLVGYLMGLGIVLDIGIVVLVIGVILLVLGGVGHPVAGRRYWW